MSIVDAHAHLWMRQNTIVDGQAIRTLSPNGSRSEFFGQEVQMMPPFIVLDNLTFNIKQMGFKHTGLFPEQQVNWDFMINKIKKSNRKIKVLNLFAYTGGASVACLYAGASVVHVDASKGMNDWAKENVKLNNLENETIFF